MIEKNQLVIRFIDIINKEFGDDTFSVVDDWDDFNSIGFKRNNKLIYICIYDKDDYFYECEVLSNVSDKPAQAVGRASVNTKKELVEIMSKFFEIERKNSNKKL
ncbi:MULTISPECIES: hypothetical protein [unclassified Rickettsia]|uniref:hypothetical protein n=1 Tax=unclassified Rickettsia TaxID=114295 RepID=UPI003133100B